MTSARDFELMQRLRAGDAEAARSLYELHGSALLRFAAAMTRCRQTAEDVVHDAFVELIQHPGRFDPRRGELIGYLLGVARHRISRVFRARRRLAEWIDADDDVLFEAPGAADAAERGQDVARLREAILRLPMHHREVLVLCDLEEMPYDAVAQILGCPIGTVRSRLHRARALLSLRVGPAPEPAGKSAPEAARTAANDPRPIEAARGPSLAFDFRRTL